MLRRIREELREVNPAHMSDETRRDLVGKYAAIAGRYGRLAGLEEGRLEALHSPLRRFRGRVRLCLNRRLARAARADVERLRERSKA